MIASKIMVEQPQTCTIDEPVGVVFRRMRSLSLRMLPVVDADGVVQGVLSTFSVLGHIVPDYIVSGDLNAIPYAPDIGLLHKHHITVSAQTVAEIMETECLTVGPQESLLSVAAALIAFGKHEYALVVEKGGRLLGIISAGDILDELSNMGDQWRQSDA
ncbi:HPP family protein [Mariprofundus ferrooxydans]|uniref:CBS domain-containing protein n=1 Tax=Mariprofundus ferrooxydans TaxID=314344 RepID=UPI000378DD7D|nr:CBS domain-containing protein [Mariprofundus ferrooxydans]